LILFAVTASAAILPATTAPALILAEVIALEAILSAVTAPV
jgi:hypothetical protein